MKILAFWYNECICWIEGYCTQSGFVHKELCIYYDTDRYDHYLFKKPEEKLSDADMVTVRWATCQLNNLDFEDGSVPYKEIDQILQKIEKYEIYTFHLFDDNCYACIHSKY